MLCSASDLQRLPHTIRAGSYPEFIHGAGTQSHEPNRFAWKRLCGVEADDIGVYFNGAAWQRLRFILEANGFWHQDGALIALSKMHQNGFVVEAGLTKLQPFSLGFDLAGYLPACVGLCCLSLAACQAPEQVQKRDQNHESDAASCHHSYFYQLHNGKAKG